MARRGPIERQSAMRPKERGLIDRAHAVRGGRWWLKVPLTSAIAAEAAADPVGLLVDAVWFPAAAAGVESMFDPAGFAGDLMGPGPTVAVVARGYADRTALGLLLAAQDLLPVLWPDIGMVGGLAIVENGAGDLNMEWAYHRQGFECFELGTAS